jgi:hypothetical protein
MVKCVGSEMYFTTITTESCCILRDGQKKAI